MESSANGGDTRAWAAFQRTFRQVQFLLDHNRLLIKEINVNQESQIPESLARNVALIKTLNYNIRTVVELYKCLPTSFAKRVGNNSQQHVSVATKSCDASRDGSNGA